MMLRVEGLETCYGDSQILFGMALAVGAGEVVTLLGRDGMGKTTTVRSIMGLTPPSAGRIGFAQVSGCWSPSSDCLDCSERRPWTSNVR